MSTEDSASDRKRNHAEGSTSSVEKRRRSDNTKKSGISGNVGFGDLFSGSDFHAKRTSSVVHSKNRQYRTIDPKELLAPFEQSHTIPRFKKMKPASFFQANGQLLPQTQTRDGEVSLLEPGKLTTPSIEGRHHFPIQKQQSTPITSRAYQLDFTEVTSAGSSRNVFPIRDPPKLHSVMTTPEPKRDLRKLSTPRFDLAGNSESGQQHTPMKPMAELIRPLTFSLHSDKDAEASDLYRGLMISPEKNSGKGRRFVRNGLAERAQALISQSNTALILWKKEIESQCNQARPRLFPDLRVRVEHIIHTTRTASIHSRSTGALRSIFARCKILEAKSESGWVHNECLVLFSFIGQSHDVQSVRSSSSISEGTEVYVWKPWHEVQPNAECSKQARDGQGSSVQVSTISEDEFWTSNSHETRQSDSAINLLCSRFLVFPHSPQF